MHHRVSFKRLGRNVSARKALYRSLLTALFKYERIRTTKTKASEVRRLAEKMITRARQDSVHNRRLVARKIGDRNVLSKLFADIAPRFTLRPGGYTRILKLGQRYGDASEMVLLELVERKESEKKRKKAKEPEQAKQDKEKQEAKEAPVS